jgi:hypothetical protein
MMSLLKHKEGKMKAACLRALLVSSIFTCGSTALDGSSGRADENATPTVSAKPTSIALFKNGLGFVTREGELPKDAGPVTIKELPVPTHGTFWVGTPDNNAAIESLVALERTVAESVPATNFGDLIEANIGQNLELRIGDKERELIQGKVIEAATNSSFFLFQSGNSMLAINKADIRQVGAATGALKLNAPKKKSEAALELKKARTKDKCPVLVQYLTKGITWAPSYLIDLTDPKKARLSAKAEIINDIDDFENVTINFIVGFPNLQFAEVVDPIAKKTDIAAFINSLLRPATPSYSGRSAIMSQVAMINRPDFGEETVGPTYAVAGVKGQAQEELFFYEKKEVSLRKGQRGCYPLLSMEVPLEHIYEWKLGNILNEQSNPAEPQKSDEVWHSVRLSNNGNLPWTTAPAMTKQGNQILGQDTLYYASPGSKTTVKITQAVDVKAEHAEFETGRKRNIANFYNRNYDLVDVQGKLTAVNYKNEDIVIVITKDITGELVSMAPKAKVNQVARGLRSVNPHQVLIWELPVKAREKVEIEYKYQIYI